MRLLAGFTRSQFQRKPALESTKPEASAPLHTIKPIISLPTIPPDIFAGANSSDRWQYKNSLNSTHYMLYHDQAPPEELRQPFTFGFLTTMARLEGKMRRKKPVTVAIIGGSVTAAYCKEPGIGCWVTPVTEWLLQENPQVHPTPAHNLHSSQSPCRQLYPTASFRTAYASTPTMPAQVLPKHCYRFTSRSSMPGKLLRLVPGCSKLYAYYAQCVPLLS